MERGKSRGNRINPCKTPKLRFAARLGGVVVLTFLPVGVRAAPAEPPVIISQPKSLDVFAGSNAVFSVSVAGTAPLRYQWFKDGTSLWQRTNSNLVVSNVGWSSAGNYFVQTTNVAGSVTSAPAQLRIHPMPGLGYHPTQPVSTIAYGGQFYAELRTSGTSGERFQWQFNGMDIPGATNSLLTLSNMKPADSGTYRCAVSFPPGPLYSDPIQVQVGRANPVQHVGHHIVLDAGMGHGVVESFQWFHNGAPIAGATSPTFELWPLSLEDAG